MCYSVLYRDVCLFGFHPRITGNYSSRPSTFSSHIYYMLSRTPGNFHSCFQFCVFCYNINMFSVASALSNSPFSSYGITQSVWSSPFIIFVWAYVISFTSRSRSSHWLASSRIYWNYIVFVLLLLSFRCLLQLFEWVVAEFYLLCYLRTRRIQPVSNSIFRNCFLFSSLILLNKYIACCLFYFGIKCPLIFFFTFS